MVDVGATMHATRSASTGTAPSSAMDGPTVRVHAADETALRRYEQFCREAVHAPAQHPIWIRAWVSEANENAFIAFLERDGLTQMAVALEVVQEGAFRIARFMGGNHANGNFVATGKAASPLSAGDRRHLADAIRQARPDVDLVKLERQNPMQDGKGNPLALLKTIQSPNVSLAVDLQGGFAEMLSRVGGKRKRKKYRFQVRKFEEAGGYRLIEAGTADEVERLVTEFFEMKAARFRKKGIHDVFAAPGVQAFFRQIYLRSLTHEDRPFVLHAVEVGGELRAVNGLSMQAESVVCEFGGIRDDDSNASPGYFLDYTNIEQACELGKSVYDFSVGDEDYKRSWCEVETWQFDVLLPLTAKGRLACVLAIVRARLVALVKSNDFIWSYVKRARKKASDTKEAADD